LCEIGYISWSLSTGDFNKTGWFELLLLDLIEFGSAPETDHAFNMTPVDQISRSIVELSESEETVKATINLPETHTVTFKTIWTEICRQQMIEPHYLNVTEWYRKLDERLKTDSQLFHGLQLFSNILTNSFSKDTTATIDTEFDLNLPMFVKALLRN
jgi:thioester reductase-like protein